MTLNQKILAIQRETKVFEKNTKSEEQRNGKAAYTYAKAIDVTRHFRELFNRHGIIVRPDIREVTQTQTDAGILYGVRIDYTLRDAESGEEYGPVQGYGTGLNGLAKGYGCAVTSALKYMLMTLFVTGSDDPADEIDAQTENNARQTQARAQAPAPAMQPYGVQPCIMQQAGWGVPAYAAVQQPGACPPAYPYMQQPQAQYQQPQYQQPQYQQQPQVQPQTKAAPVLAPRQAAQPSLDDDARKEWDKMVVTLAAIPGQSPEYDRQTAAMSDWYANLTGMQPSAFAQELAEAVRKRRAAEAGTVRENCLRQLAGMQEGTAQYNQAMGSMLQFLAASGLYDGSPAAMQAIRQEIAARRMNPAA